MKGRPHRGKIQDLTLAPDRALVMMEPRLARLLNSCGIKFTQVGEVIDYHGRRGPFCITREELLQNLQADSEQLLQSLIRTLG